MGVKVFTIFALTLGIFGVTSQTQYYGRMRGLNSFYKDHCSCSCEDLSSLIALARALEEKEGLIAPPPPPPSTSTSGLSNFEELIMKLVNALVYTTTETAKTTCRCPHSVHHSGGNHHNHNSGYSGNEMSTSSSTHHSQSDGGLISVDVLNANKNSNLLDVDVANQQVVGVGIGSSHDGKTSSSYQSNQYASGYQYTNGQYPYTYSTGQYPSGHPMGQIPAGSNSGEGLIALDLLNAYKKDNIVELDLGKQTVLGVGLGGSGGGAGSGTGGAGGAGGAGAYGAGSSGAGAYGAGAGGASAYGAGAGGASAYGAGAGGASAFGASAGAASASASSASASSASASSASAASSSTTSTYSSSESGSNSESLVNIDILNSHKQTNVADVDLAGQSLVGVGVGK